MFPSRIRSLGTAAMAMSMVASGKADAYYEVGPHCWDFAAGDLLVREAGGTVIDTSGTVVPYPLSNPLHPVKPPTASQSPNPKDHSQFLQQFQYDDFN